MMDYVIIGNGTAGFAAAIDLSRREGAAVELYTRERHHYYYRPRLLDFLADKISMDEVYMRPASWYERRGIDVHLSAEVTRLWPERKRIQLADGREVRYDRLLLATGSTPFVPPIVGADKEGVFTLRTLDDAMMIKAYASRCRSAVIVGGGLLGLEAARSLRALGLAVRVLEAFPRLMPRQLDAEGAQLFRGLVAALGLEVTVDAMVEAIEGEGAVSGVRLKDGRAFAAQLVLIAAGVRCNTRLAAEAGLEVDRGVVVDDRMATGAPGIYCAGDVASFQDRVWGIIPVAAAQGRVAAANMAGEEVPYDPVVPSTRLDIADIELFSIGQAVPQEEGRFVQIRLSDPRAGTYKKLVLDGNTLVGAIVIGDIDLAKELEGMVADRAELSRHDALVLCE